MWGSGEGRPGRGGLHLCPSAPPPPPWLPDGARAGRGRQETTGAAAGLTSCLTPEKGKVPQPPPKLGWELGGRAGSSIWVGGFLPPCSPATHLALTQHSVGGGGGRLWSMVGKKKGRVGTQGGSGPGNKHQGLRRNSVLLP